MKNHTLFRVIILQFSYYAIGENLAKEFYFLEGFLFETIFRDFVSRMKELIVRLKNTLLFHETKEADKSEKTSNDRFYNNLANNSLLNVFINLTQTRCLLLPPTEWVIVSYCALMNHTSKLFKFFRYQFICILKPEQLCIF